MSSVDRTRPLHRRQALQLGATLVAATPLLQAMDEPPPAPEAAPEAPSPGDFGDFAASIAATFVQGDPPPPPALGVIALNRLAWGPRPGDPVTSLEAFNALGADDVSRLTAFVDQQLNPAAIPDPDCDARLAAAAANLPSLNQSLTQLWQNYYLTSGADRNRPVRDVRNATLIRALFSRRQLFETVVEFWHNHFSIFAWDGAYAGATWPSYDRDVIRAHALGNFRQLLGAVAKSTAMLYYLDNFINQDGDPNENYAREVIELHTLGAENYLGVGDQNTVPGYPIAPIGYVDDDVYEATRCFTGWRVNNGATGTTGNTGTFQFYAQWHDRFQKTVIGRYFPENRGIEDGEEALDLLATHPGTARFICRKLIRRFITDQPPQSLVDSAAAVFAAQSAAPDQIKQVLRHILLAPEFRATWGQKLKRPVEVALSALRAVTADFVPDAGGNTSFWSAYDAMGQPMFGRRSPDGYPDLKEDWINTSSFLYRWRLINNVLENPLGGVSANLGGMPADRNTPNLIADYWISRLLGRAMDDPAHRAEVVKIMQGWSSPSPTVTPVYQPDQVMAATDINNRLRRMAALILMSPEFQWR